MYKTMIDYDRLIAEDMPYFDLTSCELGIGKELAEITYHTREDMVVCGTEETEEIFRRLGIETIMTHPSGSRLAAGSEIMKGRGPAYNVIIAWKTCQNILDHTSGIATKTAKFVESVHNVNPDIAVLTTRKMFPGTRQLTIKGIMAGGAHPHRLGGSETILIFEQHLNLIGGIDVFLEKLPEMKRNCCEKKILFETADPDLSLKLLGMGVDGIQIEKLSPEDLVTFCNTIRAEYPDALLLAAGGINEKNAAEYAHASINGIVTTSLYTAKPVDIGTRIKKAL